LREAKVVGREKVTVPAGTFDTYRVEVNSADGGSDKRTVWVEKSTHSPVKTIAVMPSMGGATMTSELVD
jgi:hypothetical protein